MRGRTGGPALWAGYLAVGLLAIPAYYLLPEGGMAQGLLFVAVSVSMPVAVIVGIRIHRPAEPIVWRILLVGTAVYAVANALWYLGPFVLGRPLPFPSLADWLYIPGYLLIVAALALLSARRGRGDRGGLVDAAIVTVGMSVVFWHLLIEPYFQLTGLSALRLGVSVSYPLLDLCLLGVAVRLATLPSGRAQSFTFLLLFAVSQTAADAAYAASLLGGTFSLGSQVFAGWLASYVLLGTASLHPSARVLAEPVQARAEPSRIRLLLLGLASLVPLVVLVVQQVRAGEAGFAVDAVLAGLVFLLVLVRIRMLTSDVSELRAVQEALGESERRYRTLIEQIPAVVYVDADSETAPAVYVSPYYERMLGYTPEERLADPDLWVKMLHPDDRDRVLAESRRTLGTNEPFQIEYRMIAKDGRVVWVRDDAVPLRAADGSVTWQGVLYDVSEQKALEEQLAHQAFYDPLTGLANRALFTDRLKHALSGARRKGALVTVLVVDVDGFKSFNDTMGHAAGDEVLKTVGDRLQSCLRATDTAARLGGDEFAILLAEVGIEEGVRVAQRVLASMRIPLDVDGREVFVDVSIGVAEGPGGVGLDDVMRKADAAMYAAKQGGKGSFQIFRPTLHANVLHRMELGTDLRRALEHGEFVLHYQPIVTLPEGRIVGAEALIRWRHPERGEISPADFIPVAEETGLITGIDRWVLEEACRQASDWRERFGLPLLMHVNVSARDLYRTDLSDHVREVLSRFGLEPEALTLEITEGALLEDADTVTAVLGRLKSLGIRLAIDDFGVGFSSLSYLRRLDVDVVKIDRSFVSGSADDPAQWSLVRGIIKMIHSLGRTTVAEGIESAEQVDNLRALGCTLGQGFLFARPAPAEHLDDLLAEGRLVGPNPLLAEGDSQPA